MTVRPSFFSLAVQKTLAKKQQQGWITLEVILSLVLFSAVLYLAQRQSEAHWQSLQLADKQRKMYENQQKQTAMLQLVGDVLWVTNSNGQLGQGYPDCESCQGSQLQHWFYASLHDVQKEEDE